MFLNKGRGTLTLNIADSAGKLADVGLNFASDVVLHEAKVLFVVRELQLAESIDGQFLKVAVFEYLQFGHACAYDAAVLLLLKHYDHLQQRGLKPPDILLERAVVLAIVYAVSAGIKGGVWAGLVQEHLSELN